MRNYIALTKVLLKNGSTSLGGDKKKRTKTIIMWIALAAAFAPTVVLIINFIGSAYDLLLRINQQGLVLALGISFVSIFIFFFGIFYSLNVLYFAKDIEILLPLPFKPSEILGAKFTVALFYEYLTEIILLLPLLIIYGIKSSAGLVYYFYAGILFLILPIVPLTVSSLLNMILMSFTNVGRHRDKLKILGGIVAMFIALSLNIWTQKLGYSSNNPEQMLKMITSGNNSLVQTSNKMFPGSSIAAKGLILSETFQGFINILLFLGITLVVILIFLALGEKLYFRGVVGISETSSKRKELTDKELEKLVVKKSSIRALTIRELKILFRTPVYFMNCILMNFLWPIFMFIPIFTQPELLNNIKKASDYVNNPSTIKLGIGLSLAVGLFLGSSNGITSTAISREGKNIFISKYIPVSYGSQLTSKLLSGIIMSIIAVIMMVLTATVIIKIPMYLNLVIVLLSIPGIIFAAIIGLLIDLNFPKLNWDTEVKAVKQNFNVVISLMIGMIGAGVIVFLVMRFIPYDLTIGISLCVLFVVLDYLLYRFMITKGAVLFANIEG